MATKAQKKVADEARDLAEAAMRLYKRADEENVILHFEIHNSGSGEIRNNAYDAVDRCTVLCNAKPVNIPREEI